MADKIYSVSEVNEWVKTLLDSDDRLASIYVRGELSNYKVYQSGHHYFTMKDEDGALRCVMFRSSASRLKFRPESGMKVIAFGRVTVFPRDGAYKLYVNGIGDLYAAFEQLKEKLHKEGLFDREAKKPIPRFPERIAVVTSSAGAAVRDIIRVLGKRYPLAKVLILPVRVQGAEAPPEIAAAIDYANRYDVADVIITGRGGGSIEDLWAFNDERVARAIYRSEIPVISAVGHEPDVTISDFVADMRAATPSNAAEIAVPDVSELRESLAAFGIRGGQAIRRELTVLRRKLDELSAKRVMQDPKNYIEDRRVLLDYAQSRLTAAAEREIESSRRRYVALASSLDAMSPLKVLGRGYAIARSEETGAVIRSVADVSDGERITVRLRSDEIRCRVEERIRKRGKGL